MLLPRMFSCERSFSIPTAKVSPLESFAVYGICIFMSLMSHSISSCYFLEYVCTYVVECSTIEFKTVLVYITSIVYVQGGGRVDARRRPEPIMPA